MLGIAAYQSGLNPRILPPKFAQKSREHILRNGCRRAKCESASVFST